MRPRSPFSFGGKVMIRKNAALTFLVALCAIFFAACGGETTNTTNTGVGNRNQSAVQPPANQNIAPSVANANQAAATTTGKNPIAVIDTDAGAIKVELLPGEAPVTVDNFVKLAQRGYYNGVIFHRVIKGFMIQGGDPTGTGAGGQTASGQSLPNEIKLNSPLYQGGYKRGAIAMANKGRPESGSSQFFIMHQNYPLPPNYTVFGRVIEGIETVDKIATAPIGANDRPTSPVKMKSVAIQ
jgi:cyclophilin family peptidyl-prolyl cis-trans isomerase/predicted small secreted protein